MSRRRFRPATQDGRVQHQDWLSLIEVSGPFLSLPVLLRTWPTLDTLDRSTRERLRLEHGSWQQDTTAGQWQWIEFVLAELLGWGGTLHGLAAGTELSSAFALPVPEHDRTVRPSFVLTEPGEEPSPTSARLLGLVVEPGQHPARRVPGDTWSATPVDRLAQLCRHLGAELGLVTDGRWWALVWAPCGGVTTTAVFDAVSWNEAAERDVVRAFCSLLRRERFFVVPDGETLPALLRASLDNQEEITEALGVQVRRAVELLVDAIGRAEARERDAGGRGLSDVDAHEVYWGAVTVMMRVVFLLFAEERGLLPADSELYARTYSVGRLCDELEERAREHSEDELEHSTSAWYRLLALFTAVHGGVRHPDLTLPAYGGSIFDPDAHPWLEGRRTDDPEGTVATPLAVDERTVLHMLRAVQYVQTGTGRSRERRRLTFRALDVEQIGYVYEGLLSYEGYRAEAPVVGLIGKPGSEAEVRVTELEQLAADTVHAGGELDVDGLAAAIAETYQDSKIGSPTALKRRLAPLVPAERNEVLRQLLAATDNDRALAERLLPFYGILRRDLRDLPVVITAGSLYVTESRLRRTTGTHYTPKFLAQQVAEGALEPLVYHPGPLQTSDRAEWTLRTSAEILELKVADIAMGSAAFLVAACRYLADKLVEAWATEGHEVAANLRTAEQYSDEAIDTETDPLVIEARREIIEHCLYGADINPMAVEMAKLSLWLVSMDPARPFTFLDDKVVTGDSLLGITSLDQLEVMHLDARAGRKIHEDTLIDLTAGARSVVAEIADARRKLVAVDDHAEKRTLLDETERKTQRARLLADLTVGAALAHARRGERGLRDGSLAAADWARRITDGTDGAEHAAREQAVRWLASDLPNGAFTRTAVHWPLAFPEVFEGGGFDAVIGNPPFSGGLKLTGALGRAYREHLVHSLARGARGSADVVAYFLLRAHELLAATGQMGLLAVNTLAQGYTREVGLDQLYPSGVVIRQAVKSAPWPTKSAVLEFCAVWISRASVANPVRLLLEPDRTAQDWQVRLPWTTSEVSSISTSLDVSSRVSGAPERLAANRGIAFQGSAVLGLGFTMEPERAKQLIAHDPGNAQVLFPYLNGEDLNSRADSSASRWVINFWDWSETSARRYRECYEQVERLVKPERAKNKRPARRDRWWQYAERAAGLYDAIDGLPQVLAITIVSKVVMPVMVPTGQVFANLLSVFVTDDTAMLALLSSAPHYWWAIARASTMKGDLRYTPTDVFETFARPELTGEMRTLGDRLDKERRELMLRRQAGLTTTYNLVHDPGCHDEDIAELREIHRQIDEAVADAYGWQDLLEAPGGLDHGFHDTRQGTRYTVGPVVRQEILDRLLQLNHDHHAEELAKGLHDGKRKQKRFSEEGLF